MYRVIQCPKCTEIQVSSAKRIKCVKCKCSTNFEKIKHLGCYYIASDNPLDAADLCRKIKKKFEGLARMVVD